MCILHLGRRLTVTFCIQDLLATHGAYSLLVGTGLAVVGANLVHLRPADPALPKLRLETQLLLYQVFIT